MTLKYCTQAQFAERLRVRWRKARGMEALRLARWISQNLTDAEIRAVWGLSPAQLTAVKTRLAEKVATLAAVESAAGE